MLSLNPQKTERMYPVYRYGPLLGQQPVCWVNRVTRDTWVSQGAAVHTRACKAIQLTLCLPPTVQKSISMGPRVVENLHSAVVAAIKEAWRPNIRGIKVRSAIGER